MNATHEITYERSSIERLLVRNAVALAKGKVAGGHFTSRTFAVAVRERFDLSGNPRPAWCSVVLAKIPFVRHVAGQLWRVEYPVPSVGDRFISRATGQRFFVARVTEDGDGKVVALAFARTGQVFVICRPSCLEEDFLPDPTPDPA